MSSLFTSLRKPHYPRNATGLVDHLEHMASSAAAGLLARQLKNMQGDKDIPGISCGLVGNNVFEWEVMLMISDECRFYGGTDTCWSRGNTIMEIWKLT